MYIAVTVVQRHQWVSSVDAANKCVFRDVCVSE